MPGDYFGGHLPYPPCVVGGCLDDGRGCPVVPGVKQAACRPYPGPVACLPARVAAENGLGGRPAQCEDERVVHVAAALEQIDAAGYDGGLSASVALSRDALARRQPPDGRHGFQCPRAAGAAGPPAGGVAWWLGWSCRADAEGGQGAGGVPGMVAGGGGDVVVTGHFHDRDGQVAQGGHDLGAVCGADLGGVLAVGDVADVVQGFDVPVAADPRLRPAGLAWVTVRLVIP